jgi:hypothetical protein
MALMFSLCSWMPSPSRISEGKCVGPLSLFLKRPGRRPVRNARPSWSFAVAGADAHRDQEASRSQLCDRRVWY